MGNFTITQSPDSKNIYLYPEDNGCVNECFPFGDMPNYACVDDLHDALEPETTHVWMDGASTISELYAMQNHGAITGTINYVKAYDKAKSDKYAPHVDATYKVGIAQNSDCSLFAHSGNMPLCTGYGLFGYAWMENPWTATDWTWDEVDALQAGFECSSPSVIMTPFPMLPTADGDRTDITDVTTGYEHWEAVEKEKPYAEVFESGAAWKYDLYKFIDADASYYNANVYGFRKFGDYAFACCAGAGIFVYKVNDDGTLTYITDRDDGDAAYYDMCTDGTYYYATGLQKLWAYSFDGITFTLIDSIALTNGAQCIDSDGTYVYLGDDVAGLKAFSFDGATLTLLDTFDPGTVKGVFCGGGYIFTCGTRVDALTFDGTNFTPIDNIDHATYSYIWGDGTYIYTTDSNAIRAYSFVAETFALIDSDTTYSMYQNIHCDGTYIYVREMSAGRKLAAYSFNGATLTAEGNPFAMTNMWGVFSVDGITFSCEDSPTLLAFNGTDFEIIFEMKNGNTPKYIDDNIESVTVIAKMGKDPSAADQADIRGCFNMKTHAAEYNTSAAYYTLETKQRYYAHTWTENPNTGAAWTFAEVRALQAGVGLYGTGAKYATCSRCYIVIGATTNVSPEIQTCQSYLKVNYSPEDSTCTMSKPEEISTNHARNVKMMNFWNGEREVYDLNRSGKSMVLLGGERGAGSCDIIICVRDMARDGNIITISGLNPQYFNGDYRINQFGWNKISEKPERYEWILDLESAY